MFLPHIIALIDDSKSLLAKMSELAYLAAEQPEPIASPTSACSIASISLIPSPVTATVLELFFKPITIRSLSSELARDKTFTSSRIAKKFSGLSSEYLGSGSPSTNYYSSLPTSSLNFSASMTQF